MRGICRHGGLPHRGSHPGNECRRRDGSGKVGNLPSPAGSFHGPAHAGVQGEGGRHGGRRHTENS